MTSAIVLQGISAPRRGAPWSVRVENRVLRVYEYLLQRLGQDVPIAELQKAVPRRCHVSTILRQLVSGHGAMIEVTVAHSPRWGDSPTRYAYARHDPPGRPSLLTARLVEPAPKPIRKSGHMAEVERS